MKKSKRTFSPEFKSLFSAPPNKKTDLYLKKYLYGEGQLHKINN